MGKPDYESLTLRELRSEAKEAGLTGYSALTKPELITLLNSAAKTAKTSRKTKEKAAPAKKAGSAAKPAAAKAKAPKKMPTALREKASVAAQPPVVPVVPPLPAPPERTYEPFDEHRGLPFSYGRNRCILMLKSPEWYFVHWDFDQALERRILGEGGKPALRFIRNGVQDKHLIDVMLLDRRHYVHIPGQEGQIKVELGGLFGTQFIPYLTSNPVEAMRSAPSKDDTIEFVIPEWLDTDASLPLRPMTRLEWERLYGPVPVDVPWYKARKPKAK